MGSEYVQDALFEEPILPGDWVQVKAELNPSEDEEIDNMDIGAESYTGKIGQVVEIEPRHVYPYAVQFSDGASFMFHQDELERQ